MLNATTELVNQDASIKKIVTANTGNIEELFFVWVKEEQNSGEISKKFLAKALAIQNPIKVLWRYCKSIFICA